MAATSNNTARRRLVVVDSWRGTGMGYSTSSTARWLEYVMHAEAGAPGSWRAIRFASCVPRVLLQSAEPSIYGGVPACEEPHFDLYRHVTIAGVESLRAEPADLQARDQKVFKDFNTSARRSHGDDPCRRLKRMLKSPTEVVIFRPSFEASSGMFIRSCLQRMRPQTQQVTQYIRGSCLPQLPTAAATHVHGCCEAAAFAAVHRRAASPEPRDRFGGLQPPRRQPLRSRSEAVREIALSSSRRLHAQPSAAVLPGALST